MNDNNESRISIEVHKSGYSAFIDGQPDCEICYDTFNVGEYYANLMIAKNFPNRNFVIDDIVGLLGKEGVTKVRCIVNILWIRTTRKTSRNKGLATKLMKKFLESYANSEDTIVVFRATPTETDYPTEPTRKGYNEFFKHMEKFLMPFGFQSLCGLEFGRPYIYLSPVSPAAKYTWDAIVDHRYDNNLEDQIKYG